MQLISLDKSFNANIPFNNCSQIPVCLFSFMTEMNGTSTAPIKILLSGNTNSMELKKHFLSFQSVLLDQY